MADRPTPTQVLDRLESRYRFRFGGHPRVSRDPELLDEMLDELRAVEEANTGDPGLKTRIDTARELYQRERAAIVEARAVPGAVQAFRHRLWAELNLHRYRRNFAGKSRSTRDVHLLEDIRTFLERTREELRALHEAGPHLEISGAIEDVGRTIDLARAERERIREARQEGTQAEQGTRLAQLANAQFSLYQKGFAGQSRTSRHPPRLQRIVAALEEVGAGMTRLQRAGFQSPENDRNIGIVTERIAAYRKELGAMTEARRSASSDDRANALGGAANRVFDLYRSEYAGKSRSEVSLDRLDEIFEELLPIAIEMDELDREEGHDQNERNLALVLDQLLMYQREWIAIRDAQVDA